VEVVVDLEKVVVTFNAIDEVECVTVRVVSPATASASDDGAVHRLGDVLAATNVGELDQGPAARVWISPAAVRFHAAGQVGPDWGERFAARCAGIGSGTGLPGLEAAIVWPGSA
jgi:hypothetical protein